MELKKKYIYIYKYICCNYLSSFQFVRFVSHLSLTLYAASFLNSACGQTANWK